MYAFKPHILFLSLLISSFISFAQDGPNFFRIGLIADIQYADKADSKTRFYRSSEPKLQEAVASLNKEDLAFTAVLGDLVDEGPKDLQPIMDLLNQLHAAHYQLLGNHDFPKVYERDLYRQFDMPHPYYTVEKDNWQFIFLNTNELASYAVEEGSKLERAYQKLITQVKAEGRRNAQPWNGGIAKKQFKWLERKLKAAERKGKKVVVFSHHPFLPANGLETLNSPELIALFVKYNTVKAVISGHHHPGNFEMYEGIPFITLEGMVETVNNAFGYMDIYPDKLIIHGQGRLTSRELPIR